MPRTIVKPKTMSASKRKLFVNLLPNAENLKDLAQAPIENLREHYELLFDSSPPIALGTDLLRRGIAHRLQVKAHGGLTPATRRALEKAAKISMRKLDGDSFSIPRRIKPGSEVIREWKGKTYRVVVKATGFVYEGESYASLSEIASHITGTNSNGPRFFGLRSKIDGTVANGR